MQSSRDLLYQSIHSTKNIISKSCVLKDEMGTWNWNNLFTNSRSIKRGKADEPRSVKCHLIIMVPDLYVNQRFCEGIEYLYIPDGRSNVHYLSQDSGFNSSSTSFFDDITLFVVINNIEQKLLKAPPVMFPWKGLVIRSVWRENHHDRMTPGKESIPRGNVSLPSQPSCYRET